MLSHIKKLFIQILTLIQSVQIISVMTERESDSENLKELWICTIQTDKTYQTLMKTLKNNLQRFSIKLEIKVSVNECFLSS